MGDGIVFRGPVEDQGGVNYNETILSHAKQREKPVG